MNLVEILKDCPYGTKLYSPVLGDVKFEGVERGIYCIRVRPTSPEAAPNYFLSDGRFSIFDKSKVLLFPSRDNRDWSTFKVEKPKFDVSSLQPFDKVLVRDSENHMWRVNLFSDIRKRGLQIFACVWENWAQCIPYNDDTKHLLGTSDDAPDFYRL